MYTSIKNLEFGKIVDKLHHYANCSLGNEAISEIEILNDEATIEQLLKETDEALRLVYQMGDLPFGGISDIRPHIKRASIGGVLSSQEILAISQFIYGVNLMKVYLEKVYDHHLTVNYLNLYIDQLVNLKDLKKAITMCIDENGRVLDDASPQLRSIRSQIKTMEGRIKERLQSVIQTRRDVLTESIVTMRNDRYVVPVRVDYKNSFDGIIHDQSQSGNTVYIEPQAVVEANNKLNGLLNDEKKEIERILRQLTAEIASYKDELENNSELCKTLDLIFAKAKYAQSIDAIKPEINSNGIIKIYKGRHPLISRDEVVSNDIILGEDYQAMVITGPNTGGKTVTLKTVGIFTLMMQAGLLIPANENTTLAVFDNIFSDIGDEQSIEQSLSTFSSHMTNIVKIVNNISINSLVLFDELGAGTDPKEGAALAMSILDYFLERGARIIATTHYSELKSYAYNKDSVINASVEFDVETLRPTYKLLIGIPGRSNALEISKRLGLSQTILSKAKEQIDTESTDVANLIHKLEDQALLLEKRIDENESLKASLKQDQLSYDKKLKDFENRYDEMLEKARLEAANVIERAKKEAEDVIQELKELRKNRQSDYKEHEIIEIRSKLNKEPYQKKQTKLANNKKELAPGDAVKVLTLNRMGVLVEKVNDEEWLVQIGILNSRINQKQLQYVEDETEQTKLKKVKESKVFVKAKKGSLDLDLRGERFEEAMLKLDKFIDTSLLSNYHQVTIIHGHGTGAIRKGVQEYLKKNKNVAEYRYGRDGEGGIGVTVVTFK
jgi:DNA mismatch repair protein MutS2